MSDIKETQTANDYIELTINSLDHQGQGIAKLNGQTVFVDGALEGEIVKVKIRKKHRRFLQAETIEVLSPSPERIMPKCPHFSLCGGCRLQHMSIEKQRIIKQNTLLEQLQHFAGIIPPEIVSPTAGAAWHYRRKARLSVRYVEKRDDVLIGFHEKFSRFITDMKICPILDGTVSDKIADLRALIRSMDAYQTIPQIEIAVGDANESYNSAIIFRNLRDLSVNDRDKLQHFGETNQFRIYLQPKEEGNLTLIWPKEPVSEMAYQIQAENLTLSFHPQNFIQVNAELNQKMIALALKELDLTANERVLDLFCGIGNFSLPLAKYAKDVVGVEADDIAIKRAKLNAKQNVIENADFYCANLFANDFAQESQPWFYQTFDKILLDPPRSGAQEMINNIQRFNAKRIVYISCNPATLSRDAGDLINQGYQLKKTGIIDLFPHTAHVEAIAVFDRSR